MHPILIFLLLLVPMTAAANIAGASAEQRALYLQTLPKVASGGIPAAEQAVRQLRGYPLYPYLVVEDLEWRLRNFPSRALDAEIAAYIAANPDLPRAELLRLRWLSSLSSRGRWQQLKANIRAGDSTTQQCRLVEARIRLGEDVGEQALALWRVGNSQPDACDPVFAWLEDRGLLTSDQILERARLAAVARRFSLVKYLARKLPEAHAALANKWVSLGDSPGDLHHVQSLDGDIAVSVFKRLALQDVDTAAALLPELQTRIALSAEQSREIYRYVALLLAQNHDPRALAWFGNFEPAADDHHALQWRVRAALLQGRWRQVEQWIKAFPTDLRDKEDWRYWQARALENLDNPQAARSLYEKLAGERSYHGYLAADRLGRDYSFSPAPVKADKTFRQRFLTSGPVRRAYEFLALDEQLDANREWNAATDGLNAGQLQQAALVAHEWNWHARAIITLARSNYWDDLDIRYPLPYRGLAEEFARVNALDPAYVLAIMRTESLFMPEVRSPAGAIGLMQLMPATARQVASDLDQPRPSSSDLRIPEENINLGSRYLREQLNRFSGNLALASAAYNAGPHRVSRWLPDTDVPADIWVENIPYDETREYVKRAMSHMTVFQLRLNQKITPVTQRITPIGPDSERADKL